GLHDGLIAPDPVPDYPEWIAARPDGIARSGNSRHDLDALTTREGPAGNHRIARGERDRLREATLEALHGERRPRVPRIAHEHEERRRACRGRQRRRPGE